MTTEQIWLGLLTGLLVNIVTGFAAYYFTAKRDAAVHDRETKLRNAEVAEIAINHLESSYLASKRLRIDVLSHLNNVRRNELSKESFSFVLDGISRSIEQTRISILSNILDWKHYLEPESLTAKHLAAMRRDELTSLTIATDESDALKPAVVQPPLRGVEPSTQLLKRFDKPARSSAERLMRARVENDLPTLRTIARERMAAAAPVQQIIAPALALCTAEDSAGPEVLKSLWATRRADCKPGDLKGLIAGIVAYHERTDTEAEGLTVGQEVADVFLESSANDEDKAYVTNQLGKLYHGAGKLNEAIALTERALALKPREPAYAYNLSLIHEGLHDMEKAELWIERCFEFGTSDPLHLNQAVDVYHARGKHAKALTYFKQLELADPVRAKNVLLDDKVRIALQRADEQSRMAGEA